ncbi:8344_t:CDS:2 [Acaulospora morrowiae]|uniref:8344_t:CDS:1 n=1 Tax=Acaulospora morrowiae TaxID=94023 RepID=A0A9N9G2G8_9GLOM|nr:8344_t:CDS:2 [Acaulospora morrowiae]
MPSGKDLDCKDLRKRGHNAEDCPKENKFSQGSSGTNEMQLDEDGELGRSSKDSYTANPEEGCNKEMDCDLQKENESLEETTDDYPSMILEDISIEEDESATNHEQQKERRDHRLQQHPYLEECLNNDRTLMTKDKRNNNVNEGKGNTGGCLEEKTILMRADPATKKSNQPSWIIVIREEDMPLWNRLVKEFLNSEVVAMKNPKLEIEHHQYDTCTITVQYHLVNWSKVSNQTTMASLTTSLAIHYDSERSSA